MRVCVCACVLLYTSLSCLVIIMNKWCIYPQWPSAHTTTLEVVLSILQVVLSILQVVGPREMFWQFCLHLLSWPRDYQPHILFSSLFYCMLEESQDQLYGTVLLYCFQTGYANTVRGSVNVHFVTSAVVS